MESAIRSLLTELRAERAEFQNTLEKERAEFQNILEKERTEFQRERIAFSKEKEELFKNFRTQQEQIGFLFGLVIESNSKFNKINEKFQELSLGVSLSYYKSYEKNIKPNSTFLHP